MIEINKKEDIIIPFNKIGENGWIEKTKSIIDSLNYNWNNNQANSISEEEINNLENSLGTSLPSGLKVFYKTFGISDIGEELQQFDDIIWLKDLWNYDNPYGPEFSDEDKISLPYLVSFSDYLGNGNMFCFHSETKEIYYFDHDTLPFITKMFADVDDYIKGCLIYAQGHLFGNIQQEKVEKWTEEIAENLFGKATIRKWQY